MGMEKLNIEDIKNSISSELTLDAKKVVLSIFRSIKISDHISEDSEIDVRYIDLKILELTDWLRVDIIKNTPT